MARPKKPYPGMGPFVVVLKYYDGWVAAEGANTEDKARSKARLYRHYIFGETLKIVSNLPGDPKA